MHVPALRTLLLFACSTENATFSYQQAWPRHFQSHPRFACTPINLAERGLVARATNFARIAAWRGDLIVMLHSVFSNTQVLAGRVLDLVSSLPQPKVFFIGNEYKLMPEKMAFCDDLRIAMLVSQSTSPDVHALYRTRLRCAVTGIPNTGLDPAVFFPGSDPDVRPIDLGYRAEDVPLYIGHNERRRLAEFFIAHADRFGLRVDISLDPSQRLREVEWAGFLNRCRGQLGSEAGGDYFSLDDRIRNAVLLYQREHRSVTTDEVTARFFDDVTGTVPLRIISGRHVEAAGTRTVQILFEGDYDGYFQPDVHYIPLRKDFSNADEAMRKFADRGYCNEIAGNAYEVATRRLTYERLIDRFAGELETTLGVAA
jgi:hypothetical protein